ncbi:hypothetical protein ACFYY8_09505 [Streptosporangium sp. NPDC001559]|uniref:hypothetical protein n=1 Tax=Streptosporangium sp. NPDC001559 TaxID=3366187 RepID=UPI0036E7DB79
MSGLYAPGAASATAPAGVATLIIFHLDEVTGLFWPKYHRARRGERDARFLTLDQWTPETEGKDMFSLIKSTNPALGRMVAPSVTAVAANCWS